MRGSIIVVLIFIVGIVSSRLDFLPVELTENSYTTVVLYGLLFFVGMGVGADKKTFEMVRSVDFKLLLVPIGVLIGSLLGTWLVSLFMPHVNTRDGLAIGAGVAYYSLSSVFISDVSGELVGAIALMSNISREVIALLFTPLLVRWFGHLAGIAAGGATAMDTTLPIISATSGKEWAVVSVFSGIVLTLVMPIVVPFILSVF